MPLPTVAMILYPQFNPIHFAMTYAVFSAEVDGAPLFDLKIVAPNKAAQKAERALHVQADGGLALLAAADIVVVPGWHDINEPPSQQLVAALQQAYVRGATVLGLCYGTFVLAYAGLLDGKTAATHWLGEAEFVRRFPQVKLDTNALYVEEGRLMTSAGTAAALDCGLALVRKLYGVKIAHKIARVLVVPPHREGGQAQFIEQPIARPSAYDNINTLLDELRKDLGTARNIDDVAARLSMSRSTFTRRFRKATGMAFNEWLIEAKLQRARDLLESTALSVEDIALQSGFHNTASLRQHFAVKHKTSPGRWRRQFGGE